MIIDESTRIKNNTAKRSIKVVELGRLAKARRILSGTPLPRSPADIYMQYHFLEAGLLGTKSFRALNSEFTVLLETHDPEMQAIHKKIGGNGSSSPQVARKN
ncbi:SNF2-related protein, partial [Xanthomonas pisi]|uniref:SNF2-related protein n=1 Tax=Xanthomonas pisi TaxID=56457 RepID=UPI001B80D9AC